MRMIINLTQHVATADQQEAGVFSTKQVAEIAAMTNFVGKPTKLDIEETAKEIGSKLNALVRGWKFSERESDIELNEGGMPEEASGLNYYATRLWPWKVMIGGAPWFMSALEKALVANGFKPVYAFSERVSVDHHLPDGSVKKVNEFRHVGFIE
jgi:hypothetical protein